MLWERPNLTRGRLSVFRQADGCDEWFPHLNVTLKKAGADMVLWEWSSHSIPIDEDGPPPYGDQVMFEKFFELDTPLKSPRGLDVLFRLQKGATNHGLVTSFSASLYLYPHSLDDRGIQVAVIDFEQGLKSCSVPVYFRVNFPW